MEENKYPKSNNLDTDEYEDTFTHIQRLKKLVARLNDNQFVAVQVDVLREILNTW